MYISQFDTVKMHNLKVFRINFEQFFMPHFSDVAKSSRMKSKSDLSETESSS